MKKLIDLFTVCPMCGHDWTAHFQMIEDDGTPGGKLIEPKPRPCMECGGFTLKTPCHFAESFSREMEGVNQRLINALKEVRSFLLAPGNYTDQDYWDIKEKVQDALKEVER